MCFVFGYLQWQNSYCEQHTKQKGTIDKLTALMAEIDKSVAPNRQVCSCAQERCVRCAGWTDVAS